VPSSTFLFMKTFWLFLALLLGLRLAVGWFVADQRPAYVLHDDGEDYRDLAMSLATGNGYCISRVRWFEAPRPVSPVPEAFRPPLLSVLTAPFLLGALQSLPRLLMVQALLSALLTLTVFAILEELGGRRAAWLGAVGVNVQPLLVSYSFRFSTEILFTLMLALFFLTLVKPWRGRWCLLGAIIAGATLARPTGILLLPLGLLAASWLSRGRARAAQPIAVLLLFGLVMLPWATWNVRHFGSPRLTTYFGGYNFWLGNSRLNAAAYAAGSGEEFLRRQQLGWRRGEELASSLTDEKYRQPAAQERFWRAAAAADIQEMGLWNWLRLLAGKCWHFWRPWPLAGAHPGIAFWTVALCESCLFLAGIAGLIRMGRVRPAALWPAALILLAGTVAHSLVHVYMRHRVPFVDLVMLLAAAYWLAALRIPGCWRAIPPPRQPLPDGEPALSARCSSRKTPAAAERRGRSGACADADP